MRALMELVSLVEASRDYADILAVMAEECREALGAASVSLSVWERDRGTVRTLVNAGDLVAGQERRPLDEVYGLGDHPLAVRMFTEGTGYLQHLGTADGDPAVQRVLAAEDKQCALGVPIHLDGRVWGELWATRSRGQAPFTEADLDFARLVAAQVGAGIAQAEHLRRVERLAYSDDLTGLANRRAFEDHLDIAFAQHRDSGLPVGVVVLDVNSLKQINDTQGHHAGDLALTSFASELAAAASDLDGVLGSRLGGDEFCLLTVGLPADRVVALAEDVCRRGQHVLEHGVACGVACTDLMPSQEMTPSRLLRAADAAQYRAKRSESGVPVVAGLRVTDVDGLPTSDEPDRRAFRGKGSRSPGRLLDDVLARLDEVPDMSPDDRLAVVGAALAETVDAACWFVSRVAEGTITTVKHAVARADDAPGGDDYYSVDDYAIESFPASYAASSGHVVVVDVDDARSDPAETSLLMAAGLAEMVMTGGRGADGTAWLLEVAGDALSSPLRPYAGVARAAAAVALQR